MAEKENLKELFARLRKALEESQAAAEELRAVTEAIDKELAASADKILAPKKGNNRVVKRGKDRRNPRSVAAAAVQSGPEVPSEPVETHGAAVAVGPGQSPPAKRNKPALSARHLGKRLKSKKARAAATKKARKVIKSWVQGDEGSVGNAA